MTNNVNCAEDFEHVSNSNFLYVHAQFPNCNISAMLDSGSSINLMSKKLYEFLPDRAKSKLIPITDDNIVLANNQQIKITGFSKVYGKIQGQQHSMNVYILEDTSHPFILGANYMQQNGLKLDFSNQTVRSNTCKVWAKKRTIIPPNSESILWGKVPKHLHTGYQGVCSGSTYAHKKKLLFARSVGVVSPNNMVPMKILNPTPTRLTIHKGKPVGEFQILDGESQIHNTEPGKNPSGMSHYYSNASFQSNDTKKQSNVDFLSNFYLHTNEWSRDEEKKISQLLLNNRDLFVTPDNPDLGLTRVVEHQIDLKPDAIPKPQRPYKLTPDKREVLRHHLDELLRQGIISTVSETEDIPISSPIVLVFKRNKPKPGVEPGTPEASLSMFRFCVDFRYLNSQTQDFCYAIPSVEELTESFTHKTPNYISGLDLSNGFFQMGISPNSSRFTAFNTCFGTYKFSRLLQGLKTSPNSFQFLMDKLMNGLSFKSV